MDETKFKAEVERINGILLDEVERPVPEYNRNGYTYVFGERVQVIEEDENAGVYEGEEGYVIVETVGSQEYGTERVMLGVVIDGQDCVLEVRPDTIDPIAG